MKPLVRRFTQQLEARLHEPLNFIQVVMGPRQVGKTTGLDQIVQKWPGKSLKITADEMAIPNAQWLTTNWEKARRLGKNTLFVIDEVQKIPRWSEVVKYHFDQDRAAKKLKVVLLGSASLSLSRGLSESLTGRYEIISAPHWSWRECQEAFRWNLATYLKFGGYPAAATLIKDIDRWKDFIRHSIIEPVLIKDILGLTTVAKPALFRQTFELAMTYPAQIISLQKLLGTLQESGNVSTIKHYIELFEAAFLIKALQKYSGSPLQSRQSSPKLLPLNTALIHAFHDPREVDTQPEWYGRIFETAVGAALTRSKGNLYYWREGQAEVDFVLQLGKQIYAIEVKSGRKKTTTGLWQFSARYPKSIPIVIDSEKGKQLLLAEQVDTLFESGEL